MAIHIYGNFYLQQFGIIIIHSIGLVDYMKFIFFITTLNDMNLLSLCSRMFFP